MSLHNGLTGTDIHTSIAFTYANAAARTGAVGLVAADIGKIAKQTDTNQYFILVNNTGPVWTETTYNPTFPDSTFVVYNNADNTKKLVAALSGATTGKTVTITSSHTNNRTLTLPDATDTLVAQATTDTLSNKTFSDAITGTQIVTPANPAAGKNKLYFKADNTLYSLTSAGVEAAVGAGSSSPRSEVCVYDPTSFGTTNTKIRRYNTIVKNTGTAITYADSVANGASFTINTTGVYNISYTDASGAGGAAFGISVNGTALTTDINSNSFAQGLIGFVRTASANWPAEFSVTLNLTAADVVRPHTDGTLLTAGATTLAIFRIAQVSF